MRVEFDALEKANTWTVQDISWRTKPISCQWVYKIKTKSDETLEIYKVRLVAKGYSQKYGIDYEETFFPVAWMTTVRTVIAIASVKKWPIYQIDVKNAFLNKKLVEVYMQSPLDIIIPKRKVLRLNKALYGLKKIQMIPNHSYNHYGSGLTEKIADWYRRSNSWSITTMMWQQKFHLHRQQPDFPQTKPTHWDELSLCTKDYLHGTIDLPYITSKYQLADFFTKPLVAPRFHFLLGKLSVIKP
jgi:hypothetical protein